MVSETRIKYFLVLAECLNFSRAAERLYLSQQSLSAQISSLENDLGTTLFQRTTRSVSLTPAGEAFYQLMAPLAVEYQKFLFTYSTRAQSKKVKIACLEDMSISAALNQAKDKMRKIDGQFRLQYAFKSTYQEALEGLDSGEYDLAILPNATIPDGSRYITKICSSGSACFFFSSELPNASEVSKLSDVKDYPFFCGPKNNPAREKITQDCQAMGFLPRFYEPGETPAIERMMIEAGEGIGFGDRHSLLYQNKHLIHIAYKQQVNVLAVWNRTKQSRMTIAFAEALAEAMALD